MSAADFFDFTEDHVALLQHANVGWDYGEFGAPAIDCKRPYGNSDVYSDMIRILGWDVPDDDWGGPRPARCWWSVGNQRTANEGDSLAKSEPDLAHAWTAADGDNDCEGPRSDATRFLWLDRRGKRSVLGAP